MSNKRLVPLNLVALASAPTGGMRTGDLYFNTTDSSVYVYDGSEWVVSSGGTGGGVTASGTAPESPEEGQGWFDTTSGNLYIYYDSYWVEVGANGGAIGPEGPMPDVSSDVNIFEFTATDSQTVFSGNDRNSASLAFSTGRLMVFLNGVFLSPGEDYTTTENTVTLTSGAAAGDEVVIAAFSTFSVADTYTTSQADARYYTKATVDSTFATKDELSSVEALALLGL